MDITSSKQSSFLEEKFKGLDYSNIKIQDKEFELCEFERCNFIECEFNNCNFIECTFKECVISAVKPIDSIFNEIHFIESKVIGFDWTLAKTVRFLDFDSCTIDYSNFSGLKHPKLVLKQCTATEVDFTECDLHESNFEGTDFKGSTFSQTNLVKTNFRNAFNYAINFNSNKLKGAMFSMPEVVSLLRNLDIEIDQ